jgi:Ran GTPase-activating protein (RanGAP) involved in mRNA processing and transport
MEIVAVEGGIMTFVEAIHCFNLPRSNVMALNNKKGRPGAAATKARTSAPSKFKDYDAIEVVEVSGFRGRGVTRAALKELIDGLKYLPNIKMLKLKNNGLDDEFVDEIMEIFENQKITSLDLSSNNFKAAGALIGNKLKDTVRHIQFLDMTLNFIPNEGNIALYYGV